jgi:hypothetical protein
MKLIIFLPTFNAPCMRPKIRCDRYCANFFRPFWPSKRGLKKRKSKSPPSQCLAKNEAKLIHCPFNSNARVLVYFKQQLSVHFYMEVIALMCRSIWTFWNDYIFGNLQLTCTAKCKAFFSQIVAFVILIIQRSEWSFLTAFWTMARRLSSIVTFVLFHFNKISQ